MNTRNTTARISAADAGRRRGPIAILVTDGPGLRNVVFGPLLGRVQDRFGAHVFHGVSPERLHLFRGASREAGAAGWEPLAELEERRLPVFVRKTLGYAQMFWADTGGMRYNRSAPIRGSLPARLSAHAARGLGRLAATPRRMRVLERVLCRLAERFPSTRHYRARLEALRPSLVICSNQRAPQALPAVLAARALGIPTATLVFSWDNITSKGRIAAPFDHYLVWSTLMRDELLRYYPAVPPSGVHVVGTTQFDPSLDRAQHWSRAELCARVGADAARPIIFYSGGDPTLYTAEHEYVRLLLRLIRDGAIERRPQVIVRASPAESGEQYLRVQQDFPELICAAPLWVQDAPGDWARMIPTAGDVPLLTNLIRHADVNVNLNSTMTLECALHDRPVVNIGFDLLSPPPFGRPLAEFFDLWEHYRPVLRLGAARTAGSAADLAREINAYLVDPARDRAGRAAFAALEIAAPHGAGAARVTEALAAILAGAAAGQPDAGERTGSATIDAIDASASPGRPAAAFEGVAGR